MEKMILREIACYTIGRCAVLTPKEKKKFREIYPDILGWWKDGGKDLAEIESLTDHIKAKLRLTDEIRERSIREYEQLPKREQRFLSQYHPDFPVRLTHIPDAPFGIFVKGELPDQFTPSVAVVGSRACSYYGTAAAQTICKVLGENGVQVISGLAYGIDVTAQTAAMDAGGKTFSVLASGVDRCYPREHIRVYQRVRSHGGIISEMPPGTAPVPYLFPIRNRIISGLADVTVVVEARTRSGSLITADQALEQGRDVYAVPGRMFDELSDGCNHLIQMGAEILTNPEDLLMRFGISGKAKEEAEEEDDREVPILPLLSKDPVYIDELSEKTGMPPEILAARLLNLELAGRIVQPVPNYYVRKQ